jgi:adenine phosphoribosyltransferase
MSAAERVKAAIRDIPDFPVEGVVFKDITPVLGDGELFRAAVGLFVDRLRDKGISKIVAVDARGFIFGSAVADRLHLGVVPVRKKGKLPYRIYEKEYDLEYGTSVLAVHQDAFEKGERVALVDDLLATGGTAAATAELIEQAGGKLVEVDFLVELKFLSGREKLVGYEVFAPIQF